MRTLLAAVLLLSWLPAQMKCTVNDPKSHGTLGDNLLSLDEAIRFLNSDPAVAWANLSPGEQAQFTGSPINILDTVYVDRNITPTISLERPLTVVSGDIISHVDTNFYSINGQVVIDATVSPVSIDIVLQAATNHFHFYNFIVRGGKKGVTFDSSLHYHPGVVMHIVDCLFEQQSEFGVRWQVPSFPPGGIQPGVVDNTVFRGLPIGVIVQDAGLSGDTDARITNSTFDGCAIGIQFEMTGNAGTVDAIVDRNTIRNATKGITITRTVSSDSVLDLQIAHNDIAASGNALDFAGGTFAQTTVSLFHNDVVGGASGSYAMVTSPAGALFDLHMGENAMTGDVALDVGSFAQKFDLTNSRFQNGAFSLATRGPTPTLEQNVFDHAPVTIASNTIRTVRFQLGEFVSSDVTDATSAGVTTLSKCFVDGASTLTNVATQAPVAKRWIGLASVSPTRPALNTTVNLSVDLQPGVAAAWIIGLSQDLPVTSPISPYRFYFDPLAMVTLPLLYTGQATLPITIPNNPYFSGFEFYAQPIALPMPAIPNVPPFSLPRGGRFAIQ